MANTTNLNLAKPSMDDDALITVINDNMELIDTFAGNTNEAIANIGKRTVLSSGDFNTLTVTIGAENKYYYGSSIQSMTNAPTGTTGSWSLDVIDMNSYCVQQLSVYGVQAVHLYQRQQYWSGAKMWGPWQEFGIKPTVLKNQTISVSKNSSATINIPTGYTIVFAVIDHGNQVSSTLSTATNYTTNKVVFFNTSTSFDQTVTYSLVCIP